MTTPSRSPEKLVTENEEVAKKLEQTLDKGNKLLNRAKAVARSANERLKKTLRGTPKENIDSPSPQIDSPRER